MAHTLSCVVCNQSWPEGKYRYGKEQQRRQSAAVGAKNGLEEATRDIEHLLFAALRVLNDDTTDDEEHRRWVLDTLLTYAQGACEELKERTEAIWGVTTKYIWPTHPGARELVQVEEAEAAAMEQPD